MRHAGSILGVDIGGSSIKFCILESERIRAHKTVEYVGGKDPHTVVEMITNQIRDWNHRGPVGIGFPGMVEKNIVLDAPNLGEDWESYDLIGHLQRSDRNEFRIINDADAAALAMARTTEGWEHENILCLTLGTGIGSAWLKQGHLEAGTEYGRIIHPTLNCSLETWASVQTLNDENLSIEEWAERLVTVLRFLLKKFGPDRFLLSGGITTNADGWFEILKKGIDVPVEISKYGDLTGGVGAAKLHLV